jgi:cobaltochelatase CobT
VFTREFDLTVHADKLHEMLGPLPADFQAEMAAAQTAFGAAKLDWQTRLGQEALAAKARIRNVIEAEAGREMAITLLIDHSGSMRRETRIVLAAAATDIACEFLLDLGASVEILGFTTRNWKGGRSREQWRSSGSPPNPGRLCDLLHIIYRDAADPRPPDVTRMLRPDVLKENIDGEAVEWAAGRLRARPEPHRVMIVISDGVPVDDSTLASNPARILDSHLREVISRLRQVPGLRVGAVGLGFDVSRYYPISRTVRAPEELGQALIELIEQLMKPTGVRLLSIIQEELAGKNEVLKLLVAKGLFDLKSPFNGLFLCTDPALAKATNVPLYPADYTAINEVHDQILNQFGRRSTAFGMSNLQLMKSAPVAADQLAAQATLFQEATSLANDLRDVTRMNIKNGRLCVELPDGTTAVASGRPAISDVSGQQVPRLALAGDPSVPKPPEGPRVPAQYRGPAMILTSEIETVSSGALEQAIRRRAPQIRFGDTPPKEPTRPDQRPTALGSYPDVIKAFENGRTPLLCGVSYIPNIQLDDMDKQSFVTSSWWWPETREVVARAKAHAVTVVLGGIDTTSPKERIFIEMQLVAAALDVLTSAIAVVWPDANAMWKPDMFRAELDRANGGIPHTLAVATKIGRDTENLRSDGKPTWFARTEGLNAFGFMEAEWRAFDGELIQLGSLMSGIAWYLINKGPIIGDGDSFGTDAPGIMPPIIIRHEPSTTVLGTRAYVVHPQPVM